MLRALDAQKIDISENKNHYRTNIINWYARVNIVDRVKIDYIARVRFAARKYLRLQYYRGAYGNCPEREWHINIVVVSIEQKDSIRPCPGWMDCIERGRFPYFLVLDFVSVLYIL